MTDAEAIDVVNPGPEAVEDTANELEEEREKHRKRAEKFGVEYRDPGRRREFKNESRRERYGDRGFATGFDLFTEEEAAKRQQRAERFHMPSAGIEWQPPERPLDEEKKKQRAERFGVEYTAPDDTGLMDVDLFEERKEAPLDAPRRPEAVHIYGVDLLSTSDLLKYFAEYGPSYVEWINDSSANVLFRDAPTAKRAIAGLGKPLPPEELPEGVDAADPANIEYLWHKGEDFQKGGSSIPLIFRTATVLDAKPSERVQSRRLWLAVGGAHGEGRGRGRGRGRKFRVRRGSEGEAMPRGPTGYGEHDDRVAAAPEGGGQWEDGEGVGRRKGRGAMRYKRKSGDAAMVDAMELEESAPQRARVDDREQVTYGDLS